MQQKAEPFEQHEQKHYKLHTYYFSILEGRSLSHFSETSLTPAFTSPF